jgi:hypothetical protein
MKSFIFSLILFFLINNFATSQIVNTAVMDSTVLEFEGKITLGAYIDTYYSYDFNKPKDSTRPYFVSMNRHNEVNINLAFIDLRYSGSKVRARFVPGFGTYMDSNYAAEEGTLRNLVEANAGFKLFKEKDLWVDFGVFGSPFTNESAISRDHLVYTRSFAPEYVPYFLAGAKLTIPVSKKINFYFYVLNGWQQIRDQNSNKAIATQFEYRPNDNLLLNWNTFIGKETSAIDPAFVGNRYFTDAFFIYTKNKWSLTGSAYAGSQELSTDDAVWYSLNIVAQYSLTEKFALVTRLEHFNDTQSIQIVPITSVSGFSASGSSLGVNYKITNNFLFRTEARTFLSGEDVFLRDGKNVNNSSIVTTNLTVWF